MSKQSKIIVAIIVVVAVAGLIFLSKKDNNGSGGAVRPIDAADHVLGKLDAPVKMIVYSDFQCPFCYDFSRSMKQVEENFKDQVVIAFRHYPLAGHEQAVPAGVAAECAAEQGKFWEMHDKLFADNKAGRMGTEQYKQDARDLGLDEAKFNQCLDSAKYENKITQQQNEGDQAGVTGTPTSFINGQIYVGAYPFEDYTDSKGNKEEGLKTIISNMLK